MSFNPHAVLLKTIDPKLSSRYSQVQDVSENVSEPVAGELSLLTFVMVTTMTSCAVISFVSFLAGSIAVLFMRCGLQLLATVGPRLGMGRLVRLGVL